MADLPLLGKSGGRTEVLGINTASTALTSVTAGARAYGSYVELSAATGFEYHGLWVLVGNPSAANASFRLAIGGAGSEQVIADQIYCPSPSTRQQLFQIYMPLKVPAGVRLAISMSRNAGTTGTFAVAVIGMAGGTTWPVGYQRATGYGPTAAAPNGVTVTASASAHTKGSYAELTSSTTNPMRLMQVVIAGNETSTGFQFVDVAVGAASSEVIVVPNLVLRTHANTQEANGLVYTLPVNQPSGVRVAARCQATNGSDFCNVAVIGYD